MSLSTCIHCGGHIPLGPDATNCCESCGAFVFGKPNGPDSYQAELNELRAQLAQLQTAAEVLYRDNVALSETADRLREALERIADFNCEREGWRDCKCPCGECESCIARAALEEK